MIRKYYIVILLLLASFSVNYQLEAQDIVDVDFNLTYQQIDGFGASTAWHGQISEKEALVSFGNDDGQLGLSILRLRIDPSGQNRWGDELANAKKAIARGAKVFASPWTPPASLKSNNNLVGGELAVSNYGNYVDYLNSFISYMEQNNAPICAISLQNEPNIKVTYESCNWSPAQFLNFCKDYAQNIESQVIMPEAFNFDFTYSNPVLNDSVAASHIDIIGGHLYGVTPKNYSLALEKGKRIWMTEKFLDPDDITTCMSIAKEISDCMANNMNAYIWWYLRQPSCNLIASGGSSIKKKGYIMAHFSKFIRPGYYRTSATYNTYQGMNFTAYSNGDKQVIVAINRTPNVKYVQFELTGDTTQYFQRYTTTATKNLKKESTVEVQDHLMTVELEPKSINTFVNTNESYTAVNKKEFEFGDLISILPNPAIAGSFSLNVDLPVELYNFNLRILDLEGKTVFERRIEKKTTDLQLYLRPAIYLVNLTGDSFVYNQKLILK